MAYHFNVISPPASPDPFRLPLINGGVSYKYEQSQIKDNQSPHMSDVCCDDRGALQKRPGQAEVYDTTLGEGAVHLLYEYRKMNGTNITIIHHTTKLYTQSGTDQPVELLTGLADVKGVAFVFGDVFYYIDGTNLVQYNGTTAAVSVGYIPTISTARAPAGTGTVNESLNFLSNSWKDSFNGDAATTTYVLSYTGLSATTVLVSVAGVAKTEGTHFTVDRTAGTVSFAGGTAPHGAPATGVNNVIIQAEKAALNDATEIKACKYAAVFGGANDTRIFLTGNPAYPSNVYYSAIANALYYPVENWFMVGSDADFNAGMAVMYDQLILLKQHSIFRIEYVGTTALDFGSYPLNSYVGCDMPYTIQLIDNNIVFCNTYSGVHIVTRTDVRTEKNVARISGNINGAPGRTGLLDETNANLILSTSFDWDGKYILCVDNYAYVWDYTLTPFTYTGQMDADEERLAWFPWSNINANCWLVRSGSCLYGDRDTGLLQAFTPSTYTDNGVAINGYWRSRRFYFDLPEWLKTISEVYVRTSDAGRTSLTFTFYDRYGVVLSTKTVTSESFSWDTFTWDLFAYDVIGAPPTIRLKPKIKKTVYFQVEISNNINLHNMSILDMAVYYMLTKKAK